MSISSRLKEERKRIGKTQVEFADLGDVGLSTQKNYESEASDNVPDGNYLKTVSHLVDVAYIVTGERKESGVAEQRETYKPDASGVVPFNPKVAKQAADVADVLFEKFVIPEESRNALIPMVYSLLMGGHKTAEDIVGVFSDLQWPAR